MNIKDFLEQNGYNPEFNFAVCEEIKEMPERISEDEISKRINLFDKTIITIDGDDSKDMDDAVSVEKKANGHYILGVHIADVSHYVHENTALDDEAYNRGTSVYLVDTVVPMLPKKLSNDLCSLVPYKPRLTLSCTMEINPKGGIVDYKIEKTVIKSKARMTYSIVTKILEGDMSMRTQYQELIPTFELMRELALILRDKRMRRGSIDFNFPEAKVITDNYGNVIDFTKYDISISNRIIEEFMLAANETVAKHMIINNIPGIFRIHEKPDKEKITHLQTIVKSMGIKFKNKEEISPKTMQNLLFSITGSDSELAISTIMLRSMMKARYDENNLGHYGLAADNYCHFTSPIRRYPDLFIHRMIKKWMCNEFDNNDLIDIYRKKAANSSIQSSETEYAATVAERDYTDYKACDYMTDKLGQKFYGIISSITSFGFFVELPNTIEGLVRLTDLDDDYYEFDEELFILIGRRTGRIYKIGDKITVVLSKVNQELKQIDFVPYTEQIITEKKKVKLSNSRKGKIQHGKGKNKYKNRRK